MNKHPHAGGGEGGREGTERARERGREAESERVSEGGRQRERESHSAIQGHLQLAPNSRATRAVETPLFSKVCLLLHLASRGFLLTML